MKRVLVIKLRHIGDVLLTTPVFRCVRQAHPGAAVAACVNQGTQGILETNQDLQQVIPIPRPGRGWLERWKGEFAAIRQVRSFHPDLVIDLTGTDRSAILSRLSGAPERWGLARAAGFWGKNRLYTKAVSKRLGLHVVEFQGKFLEDCGMRGYEAKLRLPVSQADLQRADALVQGLPRFVHVHPVSRLMFKSWRADYSATLLDHLAARGLPAVLTASTDPGELRWIQELQTLCQSPCLDLSGKVTLPELAAISARASLFVGVDSAPMHMAAAVGTPVIGIFGPSSENLWGPWCDRKLVLSREMDCRLPCKMKNTCPHTNCLNEMTPDMVLPKVDRFLDILNL